MVSIVLSAIAGVAVVIVLRLIFPGVKDPQRWKVNYQFAQGSNGKVDHALTWFQWPFSSDRVVLF